MHIKPTGICHICGQTKELTEEHIPPRKAGNVKTIKIHSLNDFLNKEHLSGNKTLSSFRGKISQGGFHIPTICSDCNNKTGSYYAPAYSEFARVVLKSMNDFNEQDIVNHAAAFKCQIKPLNIYKQIIAMFCSVLNTTTVSLYDFGTFLLDKTSKEATKKQYSLHMFLVPNTTPLKIVPAYGIFHTENGKFIMVSELIVPPFGFILNLTPDLVPLCLPDLSDFCNFDYDQLAVLDFKIPVLKPLRSFMMFEGIPQDKIILW